MENYFVFKTDEHGVCVALTPQVAAIIFAAWCETEEGAASTVNRGPVNVEDDIFANLEKEMSNDKVNSDAVNILEAETIRWEQYAAAVASAALDQRRTFLVISPSVEESDEYVGSFMRWVALMHNNVRNKMSKNQGFTVGEAQSADMLFAELYGETDEMESVPEAEKILDLTASLLSVIIGELCQFWVN